MKMAPPLFLHVTPKAMAARLLLSKQGKVTPLESERTLLPQIDLKILTQEIPKEISCPGYLEVKLNFRQLFSSPQLLNAPM